MALGFHLEDLPTKFEENRLHRLGDISKTKSDTHTHTHTHTRTRLWRQPGSIVKNAPIGEVSFLGILKDVLLNYVLRLSRYMHIELEMPNISFYLNETATVKLGLTRKLELLPWNRCHPQCVFKSFIGCM